MPHLWGRVNAFPQPRRREVAAAAPGEPAPLPLPRTRIWSVLLATGGPNFRATGVSPKFLGPAIVRDLVIFRGTQQLAAGKVAGIELYYSQDGAGAGTGQAISPPPAGTPLFESFGDPTQDDKFQTLSQFVPSGPITDFALPYRWDLHYLVPAGEWFLKASVVSSSAATVTDFGLAVTLLEEVDPDLVPDLL